MTVQEFENNNEAMRRKAQELGQFLNRYTPERVMLVRHLREIAKEMEDKHQSAAKQKATGSGLGIVGAGLMIVGTLATGGAAPVLLGVGSAVGLTGLGVKLTSSKRDEIIQSWREVKRTIERDREAWAYVRYTVNRLLQMVERNDQLLREERGWAIPVGVRMAFAAARCDVDAVIMQFNVVWLNLPQNTENIDAVLTAFATTLSAILAAGGGTPMTRTNVGQALTKVDDVAQTSTPLAKAGDVAEYAGNVSKTGNLSFLAKLNIGLNVISIVIDVHDLAQSVPQFEAEGEHAKRLRKLADELESFFQKNWQKQ